MSSHTSHQLPAQQQSADRTPQNFASSNKQYIDTVPWTRPGSGEVDHLPSASEQLPGIVQATHRSPAPLQSHHPSSPGEFNISPVVTSESAESPGLTINIAAARWFGLLANDAARESPQLSTLAGYGDDFLSFEHAAGADITQCSSLQRATQVLDYHSGNGASQSPTAPSVLNVIGTPLENRLWQAQEPIELIPQELFLFGNFVQRVSQWVCYIPPPKKFCP